MSLMRLLALALLLCLAGLAPARPAVAAEAPPEQVKAPPELTPEEKADAELGKAAAEEVEKAYTVVKDSPALAHIEAIVEALRPVTERPHQRYQVAIIESDAINAFALPGGYLYFTQGLLQAVESEDELAAIVAHEMAHVALNHSRRLMSRDERYARVLTPIILASVLTRPQGVDPGKIALVGSLLVQDALSHYGREAELEADRAAVQYLDESGKYHPVAVLTVVEGLTRLEAAQHRPDMGVFQTHPEGRERVASVLARLEELEVPIERRRVTRSLVASAAAVPAGEAEIGELRLNDRVVFQPAVELQGRAPAARAQESAEALNALLLSNLQLLEISRVDQGEAVAFVARGETLLTITPADAEFHGESVASLADRALTAIRRGFHEERVRRAY